ncbi:MAG: ABC transporter substrate-binding protein [Dehalococcoidales bacterium]|nr:ABC transporter substrate-binding protein [Dehalococcoidales bacterium]
MKKGIFKFFSLLVAAIMMAAMAGCNGGGGGETVTRTQTVTKTNTVTVTNNVTTTVTVTAEPEAATKIIKNVDGKDVTVPTRVERIGCLFGPSYEKVVALGAEDKIVFDGDFHIYSWPWSNIIYKHVNDVPGIVNAHSNPNIEDLVAYEPDLVLNFPNPTTTATMEAAGMYVLPSASTGSYDDIVKTMNVYAEAIGGDAPARAKAYSDYFYKLTDMIQERVKDIKDADKKTVYCANQDILKCSNQTDIIQRCGGIAVAAEITGGSANITKEQLIQWDPDYIFVDHAGSSGNATAEEVIAEMLKDPDYDSLKCKANDGIVIVPTGVFFWDAGIQKPLAMLLFASTMYPELFTDISMKDNLIDFYHQFYNYDLTGEQADMILAHLDPAN